MKKRRRGDHATKHEKEIKALEKARISRSVQSNSNLKKPKKPSSLETSDNLVLNQGIEYNTTQIELGLKRIDQITEEIEEVHHSALKRITEIMSPFLRGKER